MSCSYDDVKNLILGELSYSEGQRVEQHLGGCGGCREELERLKLAHGALLSLREEEPPRRIAFVSDKVFEPRWWESLWHAGPKLGAVSAAGIMAAILAHGVMVRPQPVVVRVPAEQASMAPANLDARIEKAVNQRLQVAVAKAVSESEARQAQRTMEAIAAIEKRADFDRRADHVAIEETLGTLRKQVSRMYMASNESGIGQ